MFSSDVINKSFIVSGSIESLIDNKIDYDELVLVQLDISNDSLLSLINFNIPKINLNVGLGSYHRIFQLKNLVYLQGLPQIAHIEYLKGHTTDQIILENIG